MNTNNFKMFFSFFVFPFFYDLLSNPPRGEKISFVFKWLACLENFKSTVRVYPIVPVGTNPGSDSLAWGRIAFGRRGPGSGRWA
jgi:hypothetical protein